ncbi:MAG: SUMF1/EgtB/PvdO family nonheme iron enzyme, partial [Prosthecobacter sp.]
LQALEAARTQLAEMAKTEQERLAVEKQRLELEVLKQQAEKEEKEAVRLLRVMMAGIGTEFDALGSRGVMVASPAGIRQDYRMAVLLSKIAVVRSRSSVLSELSDLKELSRLECQAQDLAARHFEGRDPLEITRAKWKELEAWMTAVQELEKVVQSQLAVVPPDASTKIAGLGELQEIQAQLAALRDDLSVRVLEFVKAVPDDAMDANGLFPELAEQAQYEDMQKERDANRVDALAACWGKVADGRVPPALITDCDAALGRLQDWFAEHALHRTMLASAAKSLQQGDLADAERDVSVLGEARFEDLSYALMEEIAAVQASLAKLQTVRRADAIRQAEELLKDYPKSTASSQLRQTAMVHMARGGREKRNVRLVLVAGFVVGASVGLVQLYNQKKQERLDAEAKELTQKIVAEANERLPQKISSGSVGSTLTVPITSEAVVKFSYIPAGTFTIGSPESETGRSSDEEKVEVILTHSFWLAQFEMTQWQWRAVMGSNPSIFQGDDQLPVENVSWSAAQAFIAKLNASKNLPNGWRFALPTEAQWEYACRAGDLGQYSGGSLNEMGWNDANSGRKSQEVGGKKANAWGLYDMHGNVWEWCLDAFDYSEKYKGGKNPVGSSGPLRVHRGGSWFNDAFDCRAARRHFANSSYCNDIIGFRLAIIPVEL